MKETDLNYESLQWLLEFLTLDLETADSRKLTYFAQWYFLGQWHHFPEVKVKDYYEVDEDKAREEDKAKGYTEALDTKWPNKEILLEVQEDLRKIVDKFLTGEPIMYLVSSGDLLFIAGNKGFSFGYKLGIPRGRDYDLETTKLIARIALYRLLDGLSRSIIGRCRECKKYFIRLTAKPKFFCTKKCADAHISRRTRNKDPEAYRTKMRKVMRERAKAKKKEITGIPK